MAKKLVFLIALSLIFSGCSDEREQQGLGEPYVVDLTTLPTTGEGILTLEADGGADDLSGTFQVGPYSVDIRVKKEVAREAGIDIEKPFEDKTKVIIFSHDEESSGFHQIYRISEIEIL